MHVVVSLVRDTVADRLLTQPQEDELTMNEEQWLAYLRAHAGTSESANLLYDMVTKQFRHEAVSNISNLLVAYGRRVSELKARHAERNALIGKEG